MLQRSEERFSRNAETDLVCRLLLEKKNTASGTGDVAQGRGQGDDDLMRQIYFVALAEHCSNRLLGRRLDGLKNGAGERDATGVTFFFNCADGHRDLRSFPTRRSSDLLTFVMSLYLLLRS